MLYKDILKKSIYETRVLIGETIAKDIKTKHLTKTDVCEKAGISSMALYRLCRGENTSIDTLIRVLKTIDRYDTLDNLLTPCEPMPMDYYHLFQKKDKKKKHDAKADIADNDIKYEYDFMGDEEV